MVDSRFYTNKGPFSLKEIATICEATILDSSNENVQISELNTMQKAGAGEICFFFDKKKKLEAADIKATACITTPELAEFVANDVCKLTCANPHLAMVTLNYAMYDEVMPLATISKTASIAPSAKLGDNVFVGDCAVIGDNVEVGDNCIIEAGAIIAHDCVLGNDCRIGSGANVMHTIMGNNVYIYGGARIGWDGFGFKTINGQHKRIPQLGRVMIGNDVEIGANSCIDRGALDDTVIGDGCRIDNMVQVAHNVVLGRGCILVAQNGIAGSCTFGDYCVSGGLHSPLDHH